ncbi:MAG TPA: hypothetical protein EYM84_09365, partial [Flavobacteriales bacterium]|nr:hypothetical protein [Flavobacteriales bacterium]
MISNLRIPWSTARKNQLLIGVNVLLTLVIAYLYSRILYHGNVNEDGGFYLANMERIYEGFIPIKELQIGYPPVVFYLMGLIKLCFSGDAPYAAYSSLALLFQIGSGFVLFRMLSSILNHNGYSYFCVLVMLFSMYYYQGHSLFLEPFVVFFSLCALYLTLGNGALKAHYFWAGIFTGLSFLSKQYGIAVGLPMLVCVYYQYLGEIKKTVQPLLLILLGFSLTIALCFFLFYFNYEITLPEFYYELKSNTSYGTQSIFAAFQGFASYIVHGAPFLLLVPVLFFAEPNSRSFILTTLTGFLAFLAPTYFVQYGHYYMLIIPFSILFSAFLLTADFPNTKLKRLVFVLTTLSLLYIPARAIKAHFWVDANSDRQGQKRIAYEINQHIPEKSRVFLIGDPAYFYLCNFYPPQINKMSYGYPDNFEYAFLESVIEDAPYAITSVRRVSWMQKKLGV